MMDSGSDMKIQLLMKGRDASGKVQAYRTITGAEFAAVLRVVLPNDGKRPWEQPKTRPSENQ